MAVSEDLSYLDEVAGQGFENMNSGDTAVPMLLVSQQLSEVAQEGKVPVGHFYNSISGKDYGDNIDVVVCHFEKVWVEWKPNAGGFVGRHPVGSLDVTGDVFTGMKHGENDVIETWMYLCILPDHPEDGFVLFQSTRGNLKYLKGWNTQLKYLRTPAGNPAPVFAAVWNLKLGKDQNKQGKQYYSCSEAGKSAIQKVGWTPKALMEEYVLPAREVASQAVALADTKGEQLALEADAAIEAEPF